MDMLLYYAVPSRFHSTRRHRLFTPLHNRRCCFSAVRPSLGLPITEKTAEYYDELKAAVDVVERACRLCVDVQKSLLSKAGNVIEKIDQTPVTIADFGVQALISLEMSKLFPSIPLVAEEDSSFLRENNLVDAVFGVVTKETSSRDNRLSQEDILRAIDRGGKEASVFGPKPATYWVLDPIDGTRGFVKGRRALYVVGLALVVEGEIVLGVMGCPNWQEEPSQKFTPEIQESNDTVSTSGIIMISHVGCGTWRKRLWGTETLDSWIKCCVDGCHIVHEARFCIPESQRWDSLPLSVHFNATSDPESVGEEQILLLRTCCGSLCKYLMVASGRASVYFQSSRTRRTIKVWDHAVGIICVHEAGGKVTDWRGSQLDLAADQAERRVIFPSGGVLVSNNSIHSQILELVSSS